MLKRIEFSLGKGKISSAAGRKSEFFLVARQEVLRFKVSSKGEIVAKKSLLHDLANPDSQIAFGQNSIFISDSETGILQKIELS